MLLRQSPNDLRNTAALPGSGKIEGKFDRPGPRHGCFLAHVVSRGKRPPLAFPDTLVRSLAGFRTPPTTWSWGGRPLALVLLLPLSAKADLLDHFTTSFRVGGRDYRRVRLEPVAIAVVVGGEAVTGQVPA